MPQLLGYETTYHSKQLRAKISKSIIRLKKAKEITEELYNDIRPLEGIVPRVYRLPKVHKPQFPPWPVVALASLNYQSVKYLFRLLREEDCSTKSSSIFIKQIKDLKMNRRNDVSV